MLLIKALAIWLIMAIAAVANGVLRESILNQYFGVAYALPVSGVFLAILVLIILYFSMNLFMAEKPSHYLLLGLFWVWLTLSFEYGLGYFIRGMELSEINQIFNVASGNLFALVIIVILFGPLTVAYFKKKLG